MRRVIVVLALAVVFAAGTFVAWWMLPILAAIAGAWRRRGWEVALAGVLAWSAILLYDAARGPFPALASAVAGVVGLPAAALVVVTLAFAALLAWSAAALAATLLPATGRE